MVHKKILFGTILIGLFVIVACSQAQEEQDPFEQMHSLEEMPCHQMNDGSWMGDCPESVNANSHDNHAMHTVSSEEEFIREMIPHHQEAVDTSRIIVASTENDDLQALAQEIVDAQLAEIEMMQGWITQWYEGEYEVQYENMMRDLESLQGEERDRIFLEDMILHHEMAVMMAEQVLALNPREEVALFAQEVIAVQSQEIGQMQELLE